MLGRRQALAAHTTIAMCLLLCAGQAEERCSVCHPKEVKNYLKTGMGRSITTPGNQLSGGFEHPLTGSRFSVVSTDEGMTQRVERNGLSAEYPVEYVIGSGNAAFGYLIRVGNNVFQSPVTYYTMAARNLGLAYLEIGRRKKREDYLDEGASLLARLAQGGRLDSEGLRELGGVLMLKQAPPDAGLKQLAVQLMRDALQQKPGDAEYHRSLAAALWQIGEDKQAVELLNQAIELDPRVRSAYRVLAEIHEEAERLGLALETWERYLELVPQSLSAKTAVSKLREQQ